jgi:hypothetical protein
MFHSGKWTGHWEQKGFGRQSMHQLLLTFSDGQIVGEGRDMLGEFIFIGTYEPGGIIRMVKQSLASGWWRQESSDHSHYSPFFPLLPPRTCQSKIFKLRYPTRTRERPCSRCLSETRGDLRNM